MRSGNSSLNPDLTAVSRNFRKDGLTWVQIFTLKLQRISSWSARTIHVRGFGSGRSSQDISRQIYQCQEAQFENIPLVRAVQTEHPFWGMPLRKVPSTPVPNRRRKFQMDSTQREKEEPPPPDQLPEKASPPDKQRNETQAINPLRKMPERPPRSPAFRPVAEPASIETFITSA
jgi:hypothetical protein